MSDWSGALPPGGPPPFGPPPGYLPPPPGPAPHQPPAPHGSVAPPSGPPLASWGQRLGAYLLDALVLGVPFGIAIVAALATVPTEVDVCTDFDGDPYLCEQPTAGGWLLLIGLYAAYVVVSIWYLGWRQGAIGTTVGKSAVGIRVVREHTGQPLGGGAGVGRMFATFLSALPCYLGFLWPLWDDKNQTFHDKIVGSLVVKDQPGWQSAPAQPAYPAQRPWAGPPAQPQYPPPPPSYPPPPPPPPPPYR